VVGNLNISSIINFLMIFKKNKFKITKDGIFLDPAKIRLSEMILQEKKKRKK